MRNFLILILLSALASIIFSGCSDPNSNAPETGAVHAQEFVIPAYSSQFHGEQIKETGTESCKPCHGTNLAGSATVPSCTECHFNPLGGRVPPGTNWIHGSIPHSQLEEFGSVCTACHEANRTAGNGPEPCHDCHGEVLNHPLGQAWLDRTQVGYHGESELNCALCHDLETKCSPCHFGPSGSKIPDGVDWQHGTIPHEEFGLTGPNAVCIQCHELTRSYGTGPKNCHDCHIHTKGQQWLDKKQTDFHGVSSQECAFCHDLEAKCTICHFGPTGAREPPGTGWQHGDAPHNLAVLTQQNDVCSQCHNVNRSYGNAPENCHDCHIHPLGQSWLDKQQADFHGSSDLNCVDCHDLENDCSECHFGPSGSKIPDGVDWQHSTIPHEEFGLTGPNAVCINCHELNRSYGNDPEECHDCHTHAKGREWLDKDQSEFHGTSTLECAFCHNLNTECSQCHFGPIGSKVPSGSNWGHGSVPHDNVVLTEQDPVCLACHELNRSYGNDPVSCHDCHIHPKGREWLDKNQSGFHGKSSLECASCHNLNTECIQCHFGSNGSKVPTGVVWNHGETPHDDSALTSKNKTCDSCHDLNRSFGNGPESCHDCHIHDLGQPWLDKNQAEFHGRSTLDCGSCHDLDTSCVQCHFGSSGSKIPAGINWTHSSIPHDDQILIEANDTCAACHDLNRSYGNNPVSCHDCHTHPSGQAWLDKNQTEFHGVSTLNCAECHDLGIKCFQCHFGPDGSKVPFGVTWTHPNVPHDQQGLINEEAVCTTCHELNRSFGNNPASCHDCHDNHPLAGADWVNKTTTDYHGEAAEADLSDCQACHGLDLSGDIGVSCFSCHIDNPMLVADCISCHSAPPDSTTPSGNRPNRDLAHSAHEAIAVISSDCIVCHEGKGSGSVDHYDTTAPASIDIQNGYAEFGQSFVVSANSPVTCDNVRCHGGQAVTWTDSIDLNSDCESCHTVGGSTYNRAKDKDDSGGLHKKHVDGENAACTVCHDTTKLNTQNRHFNDLDDTDVNEAGSTITLNPDSGGGPGTYNQGTQTCTVTCHDKEHDNWSWFDDD